MKEWFRIPELSMRNMMGCLLTFSVILTGCDYVGGAGHFFKSISLASATLSTSTPLPAPSPLFSGPLTITKGGTYSGNWQSTDRTVPVITVDTDEAVTISNSIVKGPGNLIMAYGQTSGVDLTVTNVTGQALNPTYAPLPSPVPSPIPGRGMFLYVQGASRIDVTHNAMIGVSLGVVLGPFWGSSSENVSFIRIDNNQAINMDDRESDGNGGMLSGRAGLGHFVLLNSIVATNGAEIAWNQVINTPGSASIEDIINIYSSQGASALSPISIHDNYLEGAFSNVGQPYTGGGMITDGYSGETITTSFVDIQYNQVVKSQNNGIAVGAGHDITVSHNRVVSSGKDAQGNWLDPNGQCDYAYVLVNFYGLSTFYNNAITDNYGGSVSPNSSGIAIRSDVDDPDISVLLDNILSNNSFITPGDPTVPSLSDEQSEYIFWQSKLQSQGQSVGVQ